VHVTLFHLHLRPGESIFDQLVFAAKKAFVSGEFQPGQTFPSVRSLAAEFKIHPNTAHKVVTHLVSAGLLETRPGIGTVVAELPESTKSERTQLLGYEIEQLAVEARKLGISLQEMVEAIAAHWKRLGGDTTEITALERGGRKR